MIEIDSPLLNWIQERLFIPKGQLSELQSALNLQELVKDRLKGTVKCGHKRFSDETGYLEQELQSLIEQSENTVKEKGSGGKQ